MATLTSVLLRDKDDEDRQFLIRIFVIGAFIVGLGWITFDFVRTAAEEGSSVNLWLHDALYQWVFSLLVFILYSAAIIFLVCPFAVLIWLIVEYASVEHPKPKPLGESKRAPVQYVVDWRQSFKVRKFEVEYLSSGCVVLAVFACYTGTAHLIATHVTVESEAAGIAIALVPSVAVGILVWLVGDYITVRVAGFTAANINLFCPYCEKHISGKLRWTCGYCDCVNSGATTRVSFLNRCFGCKRRPPALICPDTSCQQPIYLEAFSPGHEPELKRSARQAGMEFPRPEIAIAAPTQPSEAPSTRELMKQRLDKIVEGVRLQAEAMATLSTTEAQVMADLKADPTNAGLSEAAWQEIKENIENVLYEERQRLDKRRRL